MNKYTLKSEIDKRKFFISKAVGSLLVDTSDGKYILEEATVDEGENRTVFRISLLHSEAVKDDAPIRKQNLECGCPTVGTGNTETLGKVIGSWLSTP